MKKKLLLLNMLFLLAFIKPLSVFAVDVENPLKFPNIWAVIGAFIPYIAGSIGIALIGYLLYGAFLWMTAADKPDQVEGAKKTLTNAVVGFALFGVMVGLFFFLSFVLKIDWSIIFGLI